MSGRWTKWLLVAALALATCAALAADTKKPKVVIIGFDGADPALVQMYREQGKLPNIDRIATSGGTFTPLMPTNPPQTPVSWSAFATGLNPGRTEIFDFLQRRQGQYQPDFALASPGKKKFLYGEWNGLVIAAALGLVAGLLGLVVARVARAGWAIAGVVGLVLWGGLAAGLTRPVGKLIPVEVPDAVNNRQGTPFWTLAAKSGAKVKVTHVPVTFPAEQLPEGSTMISGLGVPDMRGRVGTPLYYTSDPSFSAGNNEFSLELMRLAAKRGAVQSSVFGPFNYPFHQYVIEREREKWTKAGLSGAERKDKETELNQALEAAGVKRRIDLQLDLQIGDKELAWSVSGQKGTLKPGEWSDWVIFDFPLNWLIDKMQPLRGMGRFKLISLEPEVQLYLSPINFHPSCHPVAYSWPPKWASQLSDHVGLFKTIGWSIDTWSYPSNVGGIDLFSEDMWHTVDRSTLIMKNALEDPSADVVVQIFDFTDRAGHMLWHEMDDGNPLFKPELAPKYRQLMEQVYVKMDQLIGQAQQMAGPDALFIVLSDHGFSSFRRQINYNTWLYKKGYLALKGQPQARNLEQLFDKDVSGVNVFSGIDWTRTKAWAMGLGSIYVNLVGREAQGIVMPGEEYEKVIAEIKGGLESEVDPVTGEKPVFRIYRRDEIYHDYDPAKLPDMRAANKTNYRISWQDTLGELRDDIFQDNDRVWSGDHFCSLEPAFVRGILVVNRKLKVPNPSILDIAPSILRELGLNPDAQLDGEGRLVVRRAPWIAALLLVAAAGTAASESPRERLEALRAEEARLAAERERLARDEQGILDRLDRLAADARWLDARLEELGLRSSEAHDALAETAARQAEVQARLDGQRERLRTVATLLRQAGPLGRLRPLLGARDAAPVTAALRGAHELSFRESRAVDAIRRAEAELARVHAERARRESDLGALAAQTREARAGLDTAIAERRALLADVRERVEVRRQAIDELARAARQLEEIVRGARDPAPVTLDVRRFRGLLPLPVAAGRVTRRFGDTLDPRFATRLPHQGWDVDAPFGAPIRAPFEGKVAYAGWLKGYGILTVLDHGQGIHTVYAHQSATLVAAGAQVGAGQVIGAVGDTGSLHGALLYVEVRAGGKAEDPARWFELK